MNSRIPQFDADILPLFRQEDVDAMSDFFDLRSYEDVCANAAHIYERVEDGSMPCDAMWPEGKVVVFKLWMATGMQR